MVNFTKKPGTSSHRTLDDFVEWQQAVETKARLDKEAKSIAAEMLNAGNGGHDSTRQETRIATMADELLGRPTAATASNESLAERREAVRVAAEQHDQTTRSLRIRLSTEIYADYEAEHRAARRRIVETALALKSAWDDETQLAHKILQAGGLNDIRNRLLCNFSACGSLPSAVRSMNAAAYRETNRELLK
jgi:hypothetical protein